jgi:RimJ/RimL family protein N-acetyltransferase
MDRDLITTERLELVVLDGPLIDALLADPAGVDRFSVPEGWPDPVDLEHLERWRGLAIDDGGYSPWRARAAVDRTGTFIGHVGFHGPPAAVDIALGDPTFVGRIDPCLSGVVELGYTILEPFRSQGFCTEAVGGLVDWARSTGEVAAVIATVRTDNAPSLAVLQRVGGFERIGTCRDGDDDEFVFRRDL